MTEIKANKLSPVDRLSLRTSADDLLFLVKQFKAAVADGDLSETKRRLEQLRDDTIATLEYVEMYCK
jgi:hypothetical protein